MEVYLDNAATTRVYEESAQAALRAMTLEYANPSSLHKLGLDSEQIMRQSREVIANALKCDPLEVVFTSGGTEGDNIAIIGCAVANFKRGRHIITTSIEHQAVTNTMKYLEKEGFMVTYLPVDGYGVIDLTALKKALRRDTILVSIMHTNNEVGTKQPISEAGSIIKGFNKDIIFHVDAVQGFLKERVIPKRLNIDLMTASGHKIHAPKGIGFLYVKENTRISPIIYGGGQQGGLRPGTENVSGIAGLAKAVELSLMDMDATTNNLRQCKNRLVSGALALGAKRVNGFNDDRASAHIISITFDRIKSEVLLRALSERGVYVSAGSACSARHPKPSAVLLAMGVSAKDVGMTLRFSMSCFTTLEEIDYTVEMLKKALDDVRVRG